MLSFSPPEGHHLRSPLANVGLPQQRRTARRHKRRLRESVLVDAPAAPHDRSTAFLDDPKDGVRLVKIVNDTSRTEPETRPLNADTSSPGATHTPASEGSSATPSAFTTYASLEEFMAASADGSFRSDTDEPAEHGGGMEYRQGSYSQGAARAEDWSSSGSSESGDGSIGGGYRERKHYPVTYWLDVQTPRSDPWLARFLESLPIAQSTVDNIIDPRDLDAVQAYSTEGYVAAEIEARRIATSEAEAATGAPPDEDEDEWVAVSVILMGMWLITVHEEPYRGERGAYQRAIRATRSHHGGGSHSSRREFAREGSIIHEVATHSAGHHKHNTRRKHHDHSRHGAVTTPMMLFAALLDHTIDQTLPDPSGLLSTIDETEEMVFILGDDTDLLRRITLLRQRLNRYRTVVYAKERLLRQGLSPAVKQLFNGAPDLHAFERMRHQMHAVNHVAERLNTARDSLGQANANFSSQLAIRMSAVSNEMNERMTLLSKVASICLPLTIVTSAFGMNVTVPFQTDHYPHTVVPFFLICLVMSVWLLVAFPQTLKEALKPEDRQQAQSPANDHLVA